MGNVQLIRCGSAFYIRKKLMSDITMEMCESKKLFIDHLYAHGIPVARILDLIPEDTQIFEIQEYISPGHADHSTASVMKLLADFHKASRLYGRNLIYKTVLNDTVQIGDVRIGQVLVGFEQKYILYPRGVFRRCQCSQSIQSSVLAAHEEIVERFLSCADTSDCIIHNDLTSDNLIRGARLSLIDFDLAAVSSPYVDAADVLFDRHVGIYEYLSRIENTAFISEAAEVYNRISGREVLSAHGIRLMAALKLFVYIMYIYAQTHEVTAALCEYLLLIRQVVCGNEKTIL